MRAKKYQKHGNDRLVGQFLKANYHDDQSGFFVGQTECRHTICGNIISDDRRLIPGLKYEFFGSWTTHPNFGRQFRFDTYRICEPLSRSEICLYLQRYGDGIGPKTANEIFDTFGTESIIKLRRNPEVVASAIKRLSLEQATAIGKALDRLVGTEESRARLMQMFTESKIPVSSIDEVLQKLGAGAVAKIEQNPYCLLDAKIQRVGFKTVDKLYLDLGNDPASSERQARCLCHLLDSDRSGSTWRTVDSLKTEYYQTMREHAVSFDTALEACETMEVLVIEDGMVALASEFEMENKIALRFAALLLRPVEHSPTKFAAAREYKPRAKRRIAHE